MSFQKQINKLANIFSESVNLLQDEIEENKERFITHEDVYYLIKEWNRTIEELEKR